MGAVIGFAVVSRGVDSVQWMVTLFIVIGWVLSPVLAGITAITMFISTRWAILRRDNSFERALTFFPLQYAFTVIVLFLFIFYKGSPTIDISVLPAWEIFLILCLIFFSTLVLLIILLPCFKHIAYRRAGIEHTLVVPYRIPYLNSLITVSIEETKKQIDEDNSELDENNTVNNESSEREMDDLSNVPKISEIIEKSEDIEIYESTENSNESSVEVDVDNEIPTAEIVETVPVSEEFDPRAEELFSLGQVLMAIVGSFAHGANDIANAIGPFAVVISIYKTDSVYAEGTIPWWILVMGGTGIVVGLATWGYRVIRTIGERLTKVTPSRGYNIELGSALTVMIASRLGIPLSTTHCKVGAVVGVGLADGGKAVQWRMVGNVALGWIFTLPIAGLVSAGFFMLLMALGDYS